MALISINSLYTGDKPVVSTSNATNFFLLPFDILLLLSIFIHSFLMVQMWLAIIFSTFSALNILPYNNTTK